MQFFSLVAIELIVALPNPVSISRSTQRQATFKKNQKIARRDLQRFLL